MTRTVPALVPSDFHSSRPWTPSLAVEEQRPAHTGQVSGAGCRSSRMTAVMSLTRTVPAAGAIRLPQLPAVAAVVGGEEQRPPHIGQEVGGVARRAAGMDVLDQHRARRGAVRLPQLPAVGTVVGGEEQRPAAQRSGTGAVVAVGAVDGVDVLDQDRARLVPSDFHSSWPWMPSSAVKNNVPPTPVRRVGAAVVLHRDVMSLTRTVPALVPSDFHSSRPWMPSSAVKNNVPPTSVRE